ncbi:unnamed protein product [Lactuca saligna]|uniref:Leucine-rich repeat-containing N-terminal plant-type domain-containing protein n=1 Tax=Lactuca saligna TaxID=75948 RepID=A0AA35ZD57_LACSI|nr:unnamed protein product [Lactuca saligna]
MTTTTSQLGGDDMMQCLDNERDALLLFKAPLQDPNGHLSTWRVDQHDCCKWSGVAWLHIDSYGLVGEISQSLLNLTYLNHLDLSRNSFHGTIPTFIGSLRELIFLDLSYNSLYGTIPPEFGNLTNLQRLYLGSKGEFRVENLEWLFQLNHLEELDMDGISLAKQNHWVDVILSLKKLSSISLDGCELSHVVYPYSSSILNSSSSIESLFLGNNNLTSSMYRWLLPLTGNKLRFLDLSSNMLDVMPKNLGINLCSLEILSLDNNSLVVEFPDFLNNLSGCVSLSLKMLYALRNQFSGSLSSEIQKFSSITYLDLSNNHLNGSISEKLWELPRLETLDLSFNNLRVPSTYHLSNLSYVKYIDLSSCKLLGPHFPMWIQTLKNLTFLDLSNTGISDIVPMEFWDIGPSQLQHLNLSSNNISGKVPDLSSNFAQSSVIDLSSNRFYGPIPNVPSALSTLNLSRNKFSGGIAFICQIVDGLLEFLDLSHNSLTGQLPDCLWLFKELQVLNLGHNHLFGRLPPSIGNLIQLKMLYLYKNNFSGELPFSLKNCMSLKSLNLGANKFFGNVPVWIGERFSELYVLILKSNKISGTIPLELCQLDNLQILDMSSNNLHGTIPSCLSNLTGMVQQGFSQDVQLYTRYEQETYVDHAMIQWQGNEHEFISTLKQLKNIDLSSNNLTGRIPNEITNLYDLIVLNLSKNVLFGEIPQKIGEMKNLLTLDLSRNSFSGRIPSSMSEMSLLNDLDVSFNNLSGRIPISTQFHTFPPSRFNGNTCLCGPPLTEKCYGDKEPEAPRLIGKSEGDGEDTDDELMGWFYIGGGTGFATGFWIACSVLLLNQRGRHAFFRFYDNVKDWVYVKVVVFIQNLQK